MYILYKKYSSGAFLVIATWQIVGCQEYRNQNHGPSPQGDQKLEDKSERSAVTVLSEALW